MDMGEGLNISINEAVKELAKYGPEWSQEDIDSGRAVPYEVIRAEVSEDELRALGLIKGVE
jgi:hypothetical protein